MMSRSGSEVVVVGAGIVGAACADELSGAGLSVELVERSMVGGSATAAGMGHIVVLDDSPAQFELSSHSRQLWHELAGELPSAAEWDPCGTLWIAADDGDVELMRSKHAFYTGRGLECDVLDAAQLAEAEPALRSDLVGAFHVHGDAVIYPPTAARYLIERAQQRGAKIRRPTEVVELAERRLRLSDGSWLEFEWLVVATGALPTSWLGELGIHPRKGQLIITDRYPGLVRHQLVELGYLRSAHASTGDSVAFNVQPRATGQLLVGSSRQFDVDDPGVDAALLARMIRRAGEFLPGLDQLVAIRAWTGVRAATPDKLPLIGPFEPCPGVILATGHDGLGITTSLATARLVAHHVAGASAPLDPAPYLPSRFQGLGASASSGAETGASRV